MAQSVKRSTSAQVMISWFMGLSPVLGSVLTAHSLEPASDSVSSSFSVPPQLTLSLSVSQKINIKKNLNDQTRKTSTIFYFQRQTSDFTNIKIRE